LPAIIIASIIVNIPYLGRKNSWAISFLCGGIGSILIFFNITNFVLLITVAKLSLDFAFTLSYEYTGEVYPTKHRAKGLGMASAFSRIGGISMPWIGVYISNIGLYLPYLIFGISSFIAGILTFILPYDTRGIELDKLF
jgi:hypothetical protein